MLALINKGFLAEKAHSQKPVASAKSGYYDALLNVIGDICSLFEPEECWNFFNAVEYASD
jgi:hypothetical protein